MYNEIDDKKVLIKITRVGLYKYLNNQFYYWNFLVEMKH
jgi:hypothetical protein